MKNIYQLFCLLTLFSLEAAGQAPVILSVSPAAAPVGAEVLITGNNFNSDLANNTVYFGTAKAIVTAATATNLNVIVPAGSVYAPIVVKTDSLLAFSPTPFVTSFGTGGYLRSNSFFSPATVAAAKFPCLGDFDNDGLLDMAAIIGNNKIAVYRNTGSNNHFSFAAGIEYATSVSPVQIVAADLNGDGKLELAVAGTGTAAVSVYRNRGDSGLIQFDNQVYYSLGSGNYPYSIDVTDIDGDGKTDMVIGYSHSGTCFSVARNTGTGGNLAFASPVNVAFGTVPGGAGNVGDANKIYAADIDGDGKADVTSVSRYFPPYLVFRNTSVPGTVSFAPKVSITSSRSFDNGNGYFDMKLADLDADNKPEILYVSTDSQQVVLYRNSSVPGSISFTPKMSMPGTGFPSFVAVNDMNGDGKVDVVTLSGDSVLVYENNSQPGLISVKPAKGFYGDYTTQAIALADLDTDGKADIVISGTDVNNNNRNKTWILRNIVGDTAALQLCTSTDSTVILPGVQGTTYQWQVDTGNGFSDLQDDSHYTGVNAAMLSLRNISSDWYGYAFRCLVDGDPTAPQYLKFTATWTGNFNNNWNDPNNWVCGQLPDANTDVLIQYGVVTINIPVRVRSITILPGAYVTVAYGVTVETTH